MPNFPLQNHIHLSTSIGGGLEKAPTIEWKATDRVETPMVFMGLQRSLTGRLHAHVLTDMGVPVAITNYKYILKVEPLPETTLYELKEILKGLQGQFAFLCDHYHPANNENHTGAIQNVFVSRVGDFKVFDPDLSRYLVEVQLEDAHL